VIQAMNWQEVAAQLFPQGHDIVEDGDFLAGTGHCGGHAFTVLGTTHHAEVGVEVTLAMARRVIATVREHPGRPLLFLMDTEGQRLRHRDEMLGLNTYMAHLGKCVQVARDRGHKILGLVYDQALSGGFIASAMGADLCAALPDAEIRVMNFPAMSRVTRIAEDRLRALAKTSPVFAPGAINYVRMGAVEPLWEGDLAVRLQDALARADATDHRAQRGHERGGRTLAHAVAGSVASDG
jgi:malonate decarboxylase gamma subunit